MYKNALEKVGEFTQKIIFFWKMRQNLDKFSKLGPLRTGPDLKFS